MPVMSVTAAPTMPATRLATAMPSSGEGDGGGKSSPCYRRRRHDVDAKVGVEAAVELRVAEQQVGRIVVAGGRARGRAHAHLARLLPGGRLPQQHVGRERKHAVIKVQLDGGRATLRRDDRIGQRPLRPCARAHGECYQRRVGVDRAACTRRQRCVWRPARRRVGRRRPRRRRQGRRRQRRQPGGGGGDAASRR